MLGEPLRQGFAEQLISYEEASREVQAATTILEGQTMLLASLESEEVPMVQVLSSFYFI